MKSKEELQVEAEKELNDYLEDMAKDKLTTYTINVEAASIKLKECQDRLDNFDINKMRDNYFKNKDNWAANKIPS